ncbi:MAG: XdhC family protein [Actinomycetales bacterium]
MLELLDSLPAWLPANGNGPCAIATIIGTDGSVPRPLGTSMLVSAGGAVLGSLSGGCVEGAVVEAARQAMDTGVSRREQFGYSAEDAFAAGLTCGGSMEVHIQPYSAAGPAVAPALAALGALAGAGGSGTAVISRLDGDGSAAVVRDPRRATERSLAADLAGLLGPAPLPRSAAVQLAALLRAGRSGLVRLAPEGAACSEDAPALLVESRLPPPRMLVFGANDFGAALLPAGRLLGYRTTLCDARPAFARQDRFLAADEVVVSWPQHYLLAEAAVGRLDGRTVVCVLSHDPKFDLPLLASALELDLAYLGAMGSRSSHRQRVSELLGAGADPERVARMHAPIGLDLGAVTPAEVAVSIAAEIVAALRGAGSRSVSDRFTGSRPRPRSLRDGSGAIHHDTLIPA